MNIFFNFRPILIPCFMCKCHVDRMKTAIMIGGGGERSRCFANSFRCP
jgi:hypothetical protein